MLTLHLCICDDQPREMEAIRALAACFVQAYPEHVLRLSTFQSPYELMDHLEKNQGFDLYLLDVLMPHMLGLELAAHIRARGENVEILFLTTSREYAVEAFDVRAAGYLVKPVAQDAFNRAILAAIEALSPKHNPFLLLKTRMGMRKVPLKTLVYVESFDHNRRCTMLDGSTVETPENLASLLARLQDDPRFFSPHRAYIVNLEYVNGLTTTELMMIDGARIPVVRKLFPTLKAAYLNCSF